MCMAVYIAMEWLCCFYTVGGTRVWSMYIPFADGIIELHKEESKCEHLTSVWLDMVIGWLLGLLLENPGEKKDFELQWG